MPKVIFCLFMGTTLAFFPTANSSHYKLKQKIALSLLPDQHRAQTYKIIHHLNKKNFEKNEYHLAQQELQEWDRPLIGIVGKEEDPISYQEYKKKYLHTSH